MVAFRIVTTSLISVLMIVVAWFEKESAEKRDRASIIGFGLMELAYILSLICMWVK